MGLSAGSLESSNGEGIANEVSCLELSLLERLVIVFIFSGGAEVVGIKID